MGKADLGRATSQKPGRRDSEDGERAESKGGMFLPGEAGVTGPAWLEGNGLWGGSSSKQPTGTHKVYLSNNVKNSNFDSLILLESTDF